MLVETILLTSILERKWLGIRKWSTGCKWRWDLSLFCPLRVGLTPGPRSNAELEEQDHLQCLENHLLVEELIPNPTDNAVIVVIRLPVMCGMLRPRHEYAEILQCHHDRWEPALCAVGPSVELLAEHDAARAHGNEPMNDWIVAEKVYGKHCEGHGTSKGMQVVGKLTSSDRPRPLMVALKCLNLGTKDRSRGITIIVNAPMVHSRPKISQDVPNQTCQSRLEPNV